MTHPLLDRHRATLDGALSAIASALSAASFATKPPVDHLPSWSTIAAARA